MKKLFSIILTALMIFTNIHMIKAKSIEKLGSEGQIDNVGVSYKMTYNQLPSTVYYGINGIDIVNEDGKTHLQTEFPVLKLIIINDVDKDGNNDFLVFQNVAEFNDQLFVISSKDGSVISSTRFTHLGYNDNLGNIENNSYIFEMRFIKDKVFVLYDYKIVNINPEDCSIIYEYENRDNIWDFEVVEDKIYFIDQLGQFGILDFETGEVIEVRLITNKYDVTLRYEDSFSFTAQMSLFDIYYDGTQLYVLSEDGYICLYDFESNAFETLPIGLLSDEDFKGILSEDFIWINGPKHNPTGLHKGNFRGYKVVDDNGDYLLISCYFLDDESLATDVEFWFTQKYVLYNKAEKTMTLFGGNVALVKYGKAVFAKYEVDGEVKDVVTTVFVAEEKKMRVNIFDLQGNQLLQKDVTIDSLQPNSKYGLKYDETEGYLVEIFSNSVVKVDSRLSSVSYLYDSIYTNLEHLKDDYIILSYKVNGVAKRIVKYKTDLKTVVWTYDLDIQDKNHGFETLKYDDFNMDGIDDVIGVVISYTDKDEPRYSNYIIIDGATGAVLANRKIFLYESYDDKGKKYNVYSTSKEVSLVRDLNGDGKKELLIPEGIVATSSWTLRGSIETFFDTGGMPYAVGDINGDGFDDYISISDTRVEMWTSRVVYTYNVEYKKQSTAVTMNKDYQNLTYGTVFADINNDGVKEFVLVNRNSQGYQIFDVYDGKTFNRMYSLCQDGVSDYEAFALLDMDLNNDGYNEIYHATYYWGVYTIIDGKTGEDLTWINKFEYENHEMKDEFKYHPDYLISFMIEENPDTGLMATKDYNQDGLNDFAVLKTFYKEEDWTQSTALMIYDAKTFELLKEVKFPTVEWFERYYDVENTDRYFFIKVSNEKVLLVDLDQFNDIANYRISGEKYCLINEDTILVTTIQNDVYSLDIGESFEITTRFDEETAEYIIHIEWKTTAPYAITSIYDNNTLIAVIQEKQYDLKLTEGRHVIALVLDDGQGKGSKADFEITVLSQKTRSEYVVVLAVLAVIAGFALNIYRKAYVKKVSKEGLK
ncbi:MAG TPA: VCBS repeat-containing protein [Erysipelotrichaceae bacterium]|nr:VCBS repeat-containing protein [Erysipelotrichaceae bacterium]